MAGLAPCRLTIRFSRLSEVHTRNVGYDNHRGIRIPDQLGDEAGLPPMPEREALTLLSLCLAKHFKDDHITATTGEYNAIGRALFGLLYATPCICGVFRDKGVDLGQGISCE